MQRTLFLVRHAQALDTSQGQKDVDRKLSEVGRAEASHIGRDLYNLYPNPEQILCSSALRARDTAQILAEQLHFRIDKVEAMEELSKTATGKVQKEYLRKEGVTDRTWDRESVGYKIARR